MQLVSRRRDWATGGFLSLWLTGWTVGCVFLVGVVLAQPQLFTLLFAIPFWASWVFVAAMVLQAFCQRETLMVDPSGVAYRRDVLVNLASRQVPLPEVKRFVEYSRVTDSEHNSQTQGIELRTLGATLRLTEGLRREELRWLVSELNDHLAALGVTTREEQAESTAGETESDLDGADLASPATGNGASVSQDASGDADRQTLQLAVAPRTPPSDCRWQRLTDAEDFDAIVFHQRGTPNWSGLGVLVFMNLFWNGIVGVFVCGLFGLDPGNGGGGPRFGGIEWWGLFFFLIPFEVIGLLMFAGLVAVFFDPYRTTQWRFSQFDSAVRWRWLGLLGWTWRYPVEQLSRIELNPNGTVAAFMTATTDHLPKFALVLVDQAGTELVTISGLTEGEARWMGDTLLRERKSWFRT